MKWAILFLAIASNASASVVLKSVVLGNRRESVLTDPLTYVLSVWTWVGLALYGLAFILYIASLSQFPLSIAHPVVSAGAIITVVTASAMLFGEPFGWSTVVGIALVMGGLALMGSNFGE